MTLDASGSARDRVLRAAGELFYAHGFHAVGVDLIVERAGVAKATLYRHFPTKDDLIAAYLEDANTRFWAWFDGALDTTVGPPSRSRNSSTPWRRWRRARRAWGAPSS